MRCPGNAASAGPQEREQHHGRLEGNNRMCEIGGHPHPAPLTQFDRLTVQIEPDPTRHHLNDRRLCCGVVRQLLPSVESEYDHADEIVGVEDPTERAVLGNLDFRRNIKEYR